MFSFKLVKHRMVPFYMGLFFFPISIGLTQEVQSNLDRVRLSVSQIARQSIDSLQCYGDKSISIRLTQSNDNLSMFLQNQYIQDIQKECDRLSIISNIPDQGVFITVIPLKAHIEYRGVKSKGWFKDRVERQVDVALTVNAFDVEEDHLLFQHTFQNSLTDQFPYSQLEDVESDMLLKKPPRPSRRGFRAIAEPALAIITLCGTAYLFYSIRSQ